MKRFTFCVLLSISGGCGSVTDSGDLDANSVDAVFPDATPPDALVADAPFPDAEPPCTATSCDDNDACNGVETCGPEQRCVSGTALDCGVSDSCTLRGCAPQTGCSTAPVTYAISWALTPGGASGTVNLECNSTGLVRNDPQGCDQGSDMHYRCALDGNAALQATSFPSPIDGSCVGGSGLVVSGGCSVAPGTLSGFKQLSCCFP